MISWKKIGNFLSQWYHIKWQRKFIAETVKKVFAKEKKMASRKILRHFLHANFFMFILLIRNYTVFLVQFGTNLHSCKLIPNWTWNRMITYMYTKCSLLVIRYFLKSSLLARQITARARKRKRTARMLANACKDHSIYTPNNHRPFWSIKQIFAFSCPAF